MSELLIRNENKLLQAASISIKDVFISLKYRAQTSDSIAIKILCCISMREYSGSNVETSINIINNDIQCNRQMTFLMRHGLLAVSKEHVRELI
jgi:hypothetical protein